LELADIGLAPFSGFAIRLLELRQLLLDDLRLEVTLVRRMHELRGVHGAEDAQGNGEQRLSSGDSLPNDDDLRRSDAALRRSPDLIEARYRIAPP
jgi:hypothetical protein